MRSCFGRSTFRYGSRRCLDIPVEDDLPVAFGRDRTAAGVLHAADGAVYGGLQCRVFERQVAVVGHRTVFQYEIRGVTQGLGARYFAVNQPQPLRVPAQVLAVDLGVVDRHVLGVPESVLRVDDGVADHHVAAVLERIVASLRVILYADVFAVHEDIIALVDLYVAQLHVAAVPERFLCKRQLYVLQPDAVHLAEHLGGFDPRVAHRKVARIPQRRACALGEEAIPDDEPVDVPERVFAFETAIDGFDIRALLECRFACLDGYVLHAQAVRGEQRAFASVGGVFYLHRSCFLV